VQYHDSRMRQSSLIDRTVKLIIAQVIEPDIRALGRDLDCPTNSQRPEQRGSIIRDAGARGWQRGFEADGHGFFRLPNSAVPTRMCVAPSSMATSKSCDMPIERFGNANCSPSSRKRRK